MFNFLKHLDILWIDYLKERSMDEPLEKYWDNTHNSEQYQEYIQKLGYPGTILDEIYKFNSAYRSKSHKKCVSFLSGIGLAICKTVW